MEFRNQWSRIRERVLSRDGHTCRQCGATASEMGGQDRLHAHHVRPRAVDGPDDAANCVTLCERCHREKHRGRTTYLDVEFRQTVRGYGPMTTGEVADWMGCSQTTAYSRLDELTEDGRVERVGKDGRSVVWRYPRGLGARILGKLNPLR